jgi:hypothetical protein
MNSPTQIFTSCPIKSCPHPDDPQAPYRVHRQFDNEWLANMAAPIRRIERIEQAAQQAFPINPSQQ